jgi:3-hydroxyacyl-CoA dehydrogenase/enoyl-CoA hydratase/3-hydroxybutyryl-CoA epimerase
LNEAFADRMPSPRDFRRLIENGRLGRKVGRGFYDYRGRRKRPDSGVEELLRSDEAQRAPTREAMGERLAWSLIGEAWRALADGVVANEMDGDLAAVLGIGFPAWRGGPFRFVRLLPAGEASLRLRRLAELHGPPFGALDDVLPRG